MSENVGYGPSLPLAGGALTGSLSIGSGNTLRLTGANGEIWERGLTTELMSISTSATTDTTSATILPANSVIEAVVCYVTQAIPTAATFTIGDATIAARFASGVAVAATTAAIGVLQFDSTGTSGPRQTAAAKIRITPSLAPATSTGQIRLTVFYKSFTAPTS